MSKLAILNEESSFESVWDALTDTPAESQNMRLRSDLMIEIQKFVKRHDLTQAQAAKRCQVTQPRMSDLMHGRVSKFSLDALVNMAANANLRVSLLVEDESFA